MSILNRTFQIFPLITLLFVTSCKKDNTDNTNSDSYQFVSDLKGFEYVGAFEEADAPAYYANPEEFIVEEYLDNTRALVMTQSTIDNPPDRKRWYMLNFKGGKLTETITPPEKTGPDWGNFMQFCFDHENFAIQSWHTTDKYFYELNKSGGERSYFITGGNNLGTFLIKNHLLRTISETSFWPYSTLNQNDEPQFLLTSELSAMYNIDYFFDSENYDTQGSQSIYTGYFYPSYDGNWIGVARGNQTLDTVLISHDPPLFYNKFLCKTYVEKHGNIINLVFIKNKFNPNTDQDISFYQLDMTTNVLTPVLENKSLPPDENYEIKGFRNGKLYVFPTSNATDQQPFTMAMDGTETPFYIPTNSSKGNLLRLRFTQKYVYASFSDGIKRMEFYRKSLF